MPYVVHICLRTTTYNIPQYDVRANRLHVHADHTLHQLPARYRSNTFTWRRCHSDIVVLDRLENRRLFSSEHVPHDHLLVYLR